MFFQKEKKRIEKVEKGSLEQSPFSLVWQRFRRRKAALWSLRILYGLVFVAVFSDFLANERPLFCKMDGERHFPAFRQVAADLGLVTKGSLNDWMSYSYESVIFAPIPYSAETFDLKNADKSPFSKQEPPLGRSCHWLGTDPSGHDVAARLVAGTRVALLVGLIAMSIATLIGVFFGALAGYFGDDGFRISRVRFWGNILAVFISWFYAFHARSYTLELAAGQGSPGAEMLKSLGFFAVILFVANVLFSFLKKIPAFGKRFTLPLDLLVMRAIEVIHSIPGLLLLLSLVAVLGSSSIFYVMAIIGLLRWTGIARFLRAELLKIKHLGYMEAAKAMGFGHARTLLRHALPNAMTPVLITIAFGVAGAILLESTLSFLGIGVGESSVTWGKMLAVARDHTRAWWLAVFPGFAIFLTVTVFNLIGEGLSEAMSAENN